MRRAIFFILFFIISSLSAEISSQRIAIMEIVTDESAKDVFTDKQLQRATQYLYSKLAGKLDIINQTQLKEVYEDMIEEGRIASRKECVDDSCRIELGKSASANYNLNSRITQFAGTCTFTVEMVNLKTTMVEQGDASAVDFSCDIAGLKNAIIAVSAALTGGVVPLTTSVHQKNIPKEDRLASISITSEPSGVDVSIDGRVVGRTPVFKNVAVGDHKIQIASRCFLAEDEDISVSEGDAERVSFDLKEKEAKLNVVVLDENGQVLEGEVEVDGDDVGSFPGVVELPLCTERVMLVTDDNGTFSEKVHLNERRATTITKRLGKPGSDEEQAKGNKSPKGRSVLRTFQGFDFGYGTNGVNGVGFGYHFEFSPFSFFGWDLHTTMIYAPDTSYFDVQFSTGPKFFVALGRFVPFISVGGNFIYALDENWSGYGGGIYTKLGFDVASRGKFAFGISTEYSYNFGLKNPHRFVLLLRLGY